MKNSLWIILILTILYSCANKYETITPSETNRTQRWNQDITYFKNEFLDKAKTYTDEAKDSCLVILANLRNQIDELSDTQIKLELARCVVLADNGHTTLPIGSKQKISLRFYRFSDGIYVVRADRETADYLGVKVLQINGIDVETVEAQLFPYISGLERWKKQKTIDLITSPDFLYEAGVIKTKDSYTLTLSKEGGIEEINFQSATIKNDQPWYKHWANLYPAEQEETDWTFLKSDKNRLPLYLKKAEEGVFYTFDDEEKIAYFQVNSFWDDCSNFKERVDNFNETLTTKRDYDVVIDLRFHTGGNYMYSNKLASEPPKIINDDSKIYLITSNKTYSAAIVTAARVKYYAEDKIVIVGEEVGDRLKFWAESEACVLPNSGTRIYNPLKEHDWIDNKRRLSRTHLANFLYGVPAKELDLDKAIGLSFEEYMENQDPILEWIVERNGAD